MLGPDQPGLPRDATARERLPVEVVLDGAPGGDLRWAAELPLPKVAYDRSGRLRGPNVVASSAGSFAEVVLLHLVEHRTALARWTAFLPPDAPSLAVDVVVEDGQARDASPGLHGLLRDVLTFHPRAGFVPLARRRLACDLRGRPGTDGLDLAAAQSAVLGGVVDPLWFSPGGFVVAADAVAALPPARLEAALELARRIDRPDDVLLRLWERLFA